ncbi:MAG: hypothetical protein KDD45_01190 [Bdellovibrionales bacterium]|nr:hypothetical protein [Bdellovibrionales bacterium]
MKFILSVLVSLFFLTPSLYAKTQFLSQNYSKSNLDWSDLELNQNYKSASDIIYTEKNKNARYILFSKGTIFQLTDIIPLPSISTIYFELTPKYCTIPNLKLDVFLYSNVVLILEPGCVLGVYVEAKDYYYPSFLLP